MQSVPLETGRHRLAELGAFITNAAVPLPLWELDHLRRWRLLAETLMGHPPVRGGQRPRDFPADAATRRFLGAIVALHRARVSPWDRIPEDLNCSFGSWLYAYCILIEGSIHREPELRNRHELGRVATLMLGWQVLRALSLAKDEGSYYYFISLLGLSTNEARSLVEQCSQELARDSSCCIRDSVAVRAAAEAALLAASSSDQGAVAAKGSKALRAEWSLVIDELLHRDLWLVSIKAEKVQRYIERAQGLRMARGASAWVAQSLAIVRDTIANTSVAGPHSNSGMLLLSDVDAIVYLACFEEPDLGAIRSGLRRRLVAAASQRVQLRQLKPRLAQLLDHSVSSDQVDDLLCLPDFSIQASQRLDLLALHTQPAMPSSQRAASAAVSRPYRRAHLRFKRGGADAGNCLYVRGERGIVAERDVPWLRGRAGNPLISWCGLIWSLAASSHGMLSSSGLCQALGLPPLPAKQLHKDWISKLDATDDAMVYMALDGDGVGRAFAARPVAERFSGGLEVFNAMFAGLVAGTRHAIEHWQHAHSGRAISMIPVDVIYFGGDDLVCMLPEPLLDPFLQGFSGAATSDLVRTYTGAVLSVRPVRRTHGPQLEAAARMLLPKALAAAKAWSKSQVRMYVRYVDALGRHAAALGLEVKLSPDCCSPAPTVRALKFDLILVEDR
jgi:hypothetical protein